ncbi:MAG: tripartite tricarboxylate transporter substrate binding protein [Betaproteobacteria bacterium]|nr:tripartite tricarboxylate transporter substrate binding protein [Betaproteobacteria bacterium]
MNKIKYLRYIAGFACLGSAVCAAQNPAANYPNKPIRVIIPTAAGGGSDQIVRQMGQHWTKVWGQQIVLDNRPGAGMTIGIDIATKATPDGYSLVLVNPSHAINATLMPKLPYHPVNDLIAISVVATQALGVVVPHSLPAKSVKELIALVKAKPKAYSFGSSGPGSASHLAGEMFTGMTGTQMEHIAYKGTGPVLMDLIPGRVHLYINPMLAIINQVNAGQMRLLAVTSPKRVASLPDIPTMIEAGVPGYEAMSWYMLLAPAKTPLPIIDKIHQETVNALKTREMLDMLAKGGTEAVGNTPKEALQYLKGEIERWGQVITRAKLRKE